MSMSNYYYSLSRYSKLQQIEAFKNKLESFISDQMSNLFSSSSTSADKKYIILSAFTARYLWLITPPNPLFTAQNIKQSSNIFLGKFNKKDRNIIRRLMLDDNDISDEELCSFHSNLYISICYFLSNLFDKFL